MANDIVRKRVEHGVVWITVRVYGHLYDVAAPGPNEWTLHLPGGIQHGLDPLLDEHRASKAKDVVVEWARGHVAELEMLFGRAKEQRAEGVEHGRRRSTGETQELEVREDEEKLGEQRESGVRFQVTGGMVDAAGESKPATRSARGR